MAITIVVPDPITGKFPGGCTDLIANYQQLADLAACWNALLGKEVLTGQFCQTFCDVQGNDTFTITDNAGVLPTDRTKIKVYYNGQLIDGTAACSWLQWNVVGSDIVLSESVGSASDPCVITVSFVISQTVSDLTGC